MSQENFITPEITTFSTTNRETMEQETKEPTSMLESSTNSVIDEEKADEVVIDGSQKKSTRSNKEKKRKAPTNNNLTLSLRVCVLTIIDILQKGRKCDKTDTIILANPKEVFEIYQSHYNATLCNKRQKTLDIKHQQEEQPNESSTTNKTAIFDFLKNEKAYYRVLSMIIISLFRVMEYHQVTFLFSKEHFKFFLATRKNYVDVEEFEDSNKIKSTDDIKSRQTKKRSPKAITTSGINGSSNNTLSSGAILTEYYKNCDTFNASLVRCDQDDLKALKLIIQHDLRLSPSHYNWALSIAQKFVDVEYKIDDTCSIRENYTCIQMPSSIIKRFVVMITKFIILMYDGSNQFVLPSMNVERDFTTNTLNSLKDDEYVFFDVLGGGSKKNIIDIISARFFSEKPGEGKIIKPLSENYPDRLNLIMQHFKDLKLVDVKYNSSGNCIKKPDVGFNLPSYIYIKPPLTAAIVGTYKKTAYIAFVNSNDDQLIIKEKFTISGSIASMIMVAPHQNSKFQNAIAADANSSTLPPYIYYNDKVYEVKFDSFVSNDILANKDNVKYLRNVIPVELISNKLGRLSSHPIAHVDEYRQSSILKDSNIEQLLRIPIHDLATKLNKYIDTAALIKTLKSFQPTIEIEDYE
uniref:TopB_0 protein n=1 Tax=Fopius arisanus TaxID=64838 RepID=A0A0C9PMH8_9HYME